MSALWGFVRPHGGLALLALVALLASSAFTLAIPAALRGVVDSFSPKHAAEIDRYFVWLLVAAGALAVFTALRFYAVAGLGERVVADIRRAVYGHVVGMSPAFFERMRIGETLSRLTTDTTVIQGVIGVSSSVALRNILILVGGAAMMTATSPSLSGLVLLATPAVVLPVVLLGRRVRGLSRLAQDRIADSSATAGETLQASQTVQAFGYEPEARRIFDADVEAAYGAALKRIRMRAILTGLVIFIAVGAIAGVLWVGAQNVLSRQMSPGELTQFLLYSVFVAGSVGALSEVWSELQRAAGATERLMELLAAKDPIQPPAQPVAPTDISLDRPKLGEITFDNVSFRYPTRPNAPVLNQLSFQVKPGETVALVGASGAGKSTCFQLLMRFFDPDQGAVRLDGVDLRAMAPSTFRRRFATVPQEPAIFAASAAENIRFGCPDATLADVKAAAEAAAAHEFIAALPDGYDCFVGERGVMLSGGQKQRIAIARAILRDAPVLLLDEATSALDAESEQAVQQAVARLSAERTTLVVAHRLATVKSADRILVLEEGRLVASGVHDQLVAEGGLYARLARLQFSA
ncbi:MAG: ABC transporter transmembrane domain-containing protein [Neomegalonema sp.]|nr:ABC transporter transmembrane domain-containing protein [Neomegalonema sp.]